MSEYLKVTKNIAVKVKKSKCEIPVQTELSLTGVTGFQSIHSNVISDEAIKNMGTCLFPFLNGQLKELPTKEVMSWEELYKDSETILNSQSRYIVSPVETVAEKPFPNLHEACLYEYLNKYSDSHVKAAAGVYAFLNVKQ